MLQTWAMLLVIAILYSLVHLSEAATTITVYSTVDSAGTSSNCYPAASASCNLRSAWLACQSIVGQCVIQFSVTDYVYMDLNSFGSLNLLDTSNIVINGGGSLVVVPTQANIDDSLFAYRVSSFPGTTNVPSLILQDSIFAFFGSTNAWGGVVYIKGNANLNVIGSYFFSNTAMYGGSVYVSYNTQPVNIVSSDFEKDKGGVYGGSIYTYKSGPLSVTDSTFTNCVGYEEGGAITIEYGNNFLLDTTTFESCSTSGRGGAVSLYTVTNVQVTNSIFNKSKSNFYSGCLGMDYVTNAAITTTSFVDCVSVTNGGAMRIGGYNTNITIDDCLFERCASRHGGSVYLWTTNKNFAITNSRMVDTSATGMGGALNFYNLNTNIVISNINMSCVGTGSWGGAICLNAYNTKVMITDVSITNCQATQGGGIYLYDNNTYVSIMNTKIQQCAATTGGGIFADSNNNNLRVVNCVIDNNIASQYGGGLYFNSKNQGAMLAGINVTNNKAWSGGGLYASQNNPQIAILDMKSYQNSYVLQTSHPYSSALNKVIFQQYINVPGVTSWILIFNSLSMIYSLTDTLYIYSDMSKKTLLYKSSSSGNFPGTYYPSLIIPGSSVYVLFTGPSTTTYAPTTLAQNFYGFTIYLTPIFQTVIQPTIFRGNEATYEGGALYFFTEMAFPVLLNVIVHDNKAVTGGGGGLSMRAEISGLTMYGAKFRRNSAGYNGGALQFSTAHYGAVITNCTFEDNVAQIYGGAAMVDSYNGNGVLLYGNEISFIDCSFIQNSASRGGGLYISDRNSVIVSDCLVASNNATISYGGGIGVKANSSVVISRTRIYNNFASSTGGAISSLLGNNISLVNVEMSDNIAGKYGGAIFASTFTQLTFNSSIIITGNKAESGGGIALVSSPLWALHTSTPIEVVNNRAGRGPAFLFYQLHTSNNRLHDILIESNEATVGGIVYWIYDTIMDKEPPGIREASIMWNKNSAPYGIRVGTQATTLHSPKNYDAVVYGTSLVPNPVLTMTDYYDQFIPLSGDTAVRVYLANADQEATCAGIHPYLTGTDLLKHGVPFSNGTATFADLQAFCAPGGSLNVTFQAQLGILIIDLGKIETYYIQNSTIFNFRACRPGEFTKNGVCLVCPFGFYTLIGSETECSSCSKIAGVQDCYSNQIYLEPNYWRRFEDNAAVLSCPIDGSCIGGNMTGQSVCAFGYTGPLCAVCDDDHYFDGTTCVSCVNGGAATPNMIIFVILASTVLIMASSYFYFEKKFVTGKTESPTELIGIIYVTARFKVLSLYNRLKDRFGSTIIKLKIIVSTYQIVVESFSVLNIYNSPENFDKFISSFNFLNLNLATTFPFSCSWKIDFIGILVIMTLVPIGLVLAFAIAFFAEYAMKTRKSEDKEFKASTYLELENKYLNYIFYLTYLVLPSVTTALFQTFLCTNIDPENNDPDLANSFLTADMSISCTSSYYHKGVIYAIIMIVIYPIGIPLMYFTLLYRNKEEIMNRDEVEESTVTNTNPMMETKVTHETSEVKVESAETKNGMVMENGKELSPSASRLTFLWEAYEPQFWYWEIIETTRRLMLTAILSVSKPGTSDQNVLSILMALIYIKLYGYFKPYSADRDDILAETGQFQIFLTFFGGMIFQNNLVSRSVYNICGAALALVNLSVLIMSAHFEISDQLEEVAKLNGLEVAHTKGIMGYLRGAYLIFFHSPKKAHNHPANPKSDVIKPATPISPAFSGNNATEEL